MDTPGPDLLDIQGDIPIGLQKRAELFLFFKIVDPARFRDLAREVAVGRLTSVQRVLQRERLAEERRRLGERGNEPWLGLNLGFTKDGLTQLLGTARAARPKSAVFPK